MATTALARRSRATRPVSLVALFLRSIGLHRQRKQLARLDDRLLRDIGLTAAEAAQEAARPAWDVPDQWRQ